MTRKDFEKMNFNELMNWAYENLCEISDGETLKEYAIKLLQNDNFELALHIINAIYENPSDTEWYEYDYSMGTLDIPIPITEKGDIEDLIDFED